MMNDDNENENRNHVGRNNVFHMNNNDETNHENSIDEDALILDTNINNDKRTTMMTMNDE